MSSNTISASVTLKQFQTIDDQLRQYNVKLNLAIQEYNAAANSQLSSEAKEQNIEPVDLSKLDLRDLENWFPPQAVGERVVAPPIARIILQHNAAQEIWQLLIQKYCLLLAITPIFLAENPLVIPAHDSKIEFFFDVFKKLVDLVDDVWSAVRNAISNAKEGISAALIGGCGFIIHLGEGIIALKDIWHVINGNEKKQIKTRLFTSGLSAFAAGAGFGISSTLIIHGISSTLEAGPLVTLAGFDLLTVLAPGLLTGIYTLSLWRKSYILLKTQEEKTSALQAAAREYLNQINRLQAEIATYRQTLDETLREITYQSSYSNSQLRTITLATKNLFSAEKDLAFLKTHRKEYILSQCKDTIEACLEAERQVAFTSVEVLGSITVLIGILIGTTALIGGTGGAALPLICIGVAIGCSTKLLEHLNKRANYAWTNNIRSWLFAKFNIPLMSIPNIEHTNGHHTKPDALAEPTRGQSKIILPPCPEMKRDPTPNPIAPAPEIKPAVNHGSNPHGLLAPRKSTTAEQRASRIVSAASFGIRF